MIKIPPPPERKSPPKSGYVCRKKFNHVYQFKVTLKEIKPPIWRRVQVPEIYTFWDLHVAIQDALDWWDYHLHAFRMRDPITDTKVSIGIPMENDFEDQEVFAAGWNIPIAAMFTFQNPKADYEYDFGDCWKHIVRLEKILPRNKEAGYPCCIAGKRACPPEDCGGSYGYDLVLSGEAVDEDGTPFYPDYDPERFEVEKVGFDDPEGPADLLLPGAAATGPAPFRLGASCP